MTPVVLGGQGSVVMHQQASRPSNRAACHDLRNRLALAEFPVLISPHYLGRRFPAVSARSPRLESQAANSFQRDAIDEVSGQELKLLGHRHLRRLFP